MAVFLFLNFVARFCFISFLSARGENRLLSRIFYFVSLTKYLAPSTPTQALPHSLSLVPGFARLWFDSTPTSKAKASNTVMSKAIALCARGENRTPTPFGTRFLISFLSARGENRLLSRIFYFVSLTKYLAPSTPTQALPHSLSLVPGFARLWFDSTPTSKAKASNTVMSKAIALCARGENRTPTPFGTRFLISFLSARGENRTPTPFGTRF